MPTLTIIYGEETQTIEAPQGALLGERVEIGLVSARTLRPKSKRARGNEDEYEACVNG